MVNQSLEETVRHKYRDITLSLIEKKMTITTMESCTSGQIASLITDTEGSSDVIKGAFVTYSNEAKIMQGVPANIIAEYGVYSKETAVAMANAARDKYDAKIAIGVTGTMGNVDPSNNDSIPGEVYFAIATNDGTMDYFAQIPVQNTRHEYKIYVANLIADELISIITPGSVTF